MLKRLYMKKILLIFSVLTLILYAELPPYIYESYQKNAPEALTIEVKKVETSLISISEKSVTITAKVIRIKRSQSQLKRGDTITIVYNSTFWKPSGWVGPSSLRILEEHQIYKAFLRKGEKNNYYFPAAKGKSFK